MHNDDKALKLVQEQSETLEKSLKLGIYRAMLAEGMLTDKQLCSLLADKGSLV